MGLITAVEDQLSLSDLPQPASDLRAAAVAEDTVTAMHSAVETQQQQEQQDACAVTSGDDQQPHDRHIPQQLQTHTDDAGTGADGRHDKGDGSEDQDAAAAAAAGAGAEAAANEAAVCSEQQVRARHFPCSWSVHAFCCY